jgi:DNA-binding transcriptional LysR family regulator
MFLKSLRVFHEAVRLQSIRKASDHLRMAPSSASRQIALLEHQIGTNLLDRSASGVAVTHAGALVIEFARTVLLDYDSLRTDLDDYKGGRRAQIKIAAVEGVMGSGPLAVITSFRKDFEHVSFTLNMMPAPAVVEAVRQGSADIGLTFSPQPDPDLETIVLFREPLFLVTLDTGDSERAASVSMRELAAIGLALPAPDFGITRLLDAAARSEGVKLVPVLSSNSFEALRQFVLSGGGGAVLPGRMLDQRRDPMLKFTPIKDKYLEHTDIEMMMLPKRRQSRILRLFRDRLVRSLREL